MPFLPKIVHFLPIYKVDGQMMGESFWPKDSFTTHILFELCLFRYLVQSTYFRDTLHVQTYFSRRPGLFGVFFTYAAQYAGPFVHTLFKKKFFSTGAHHCHTGIYNTVTINLPISFTGQLVSECLFVVPEK